MGGKDGVFWGRRGRSDANGRRECVVDERQRVIDGRPGLGWVGKGGQEQTSN